jgi:hypothetical protein
LGEKAKGRKKDSSFFGKKEAKKLYPFDAGALNQASQVIKVFLLLFFQKKKTLPTPCLPSPDRTDH